MYTVILVVASGISFLGALIAALFSPAGDSSLDIRANPLVRPLLVLAAILFIAALFFFAVPEVFMPFVGTVGFIAFAAALVFLHNRVRRLEEHVRSKDKQ